MAEVPAPDTSGALQDPKWARAKTGRFFRLLNFEPQKYGLDGIGGVYVVWHAGVRPQWLYVGETDNLAAVFRELPKNREIMQYEVHGGVFVTWSPVIEEYRPGVVRFLHAGLKPLIKNPAALDEEVDPIPVLAPGAKAPGA